MKKDNQDIFKATTIIIIIITKLLTNLFQSTIAPLTIKSPERRKMDVINPIMITAKTN